MKTDFVIKLAQKGANIYNTGMKKVLLFANFIMLCSSLVSARNLKPSFIKTIEQKKIDAAFESFMATLSKEELVSQIFLVNIEGNKDYSAVESTSSLQVPKPLVPGGCLLFSFNLAPSFKETASFIDSIASYCSLNSVLPPYVALDQEGGYVSRLSELSSRLPSQKTVALRLSPSKAYELYSLQAKQMKALGINMNLAPVAEAETPLNAAMLLTRSYGKAPASQVYSASCVRAYEENGIASVLKHFPGNTSTDPHTGLPEIDCSENEIESLYIAPFAFILFQKPSAVLMSHARIKPSALGHPGDSLTPACLSSLWVEKILKQDMGFSSLILSDDIFMGALGDNGFLPEKAVVQAVKAGVNVIMLSEKKFGSVANVVLDYEKKDKDFAVKLHDAEKKVLEFKVKKGILKLKREGNSYKIEAAAPLTRDSLEKREADFKNAKEEGRKFFASNFIAGEP